jgi:dephospho-CoA kinase
MLRVGLTGGLASGKSTVGRMLADLGCLLIEDDKLGHQVMEPGGEAYTGILTDFGSEFVNPDGTLNRRRLGSIVFSNPDRLAKLNELIHPAVHARERELVEAYAKDHPDGIAVTEAAILVETGSYKDYDRLIVAVCRPEQQMERSLARDQLTRQEVLDRLSRQMPLEEKAKYADFIIDTSGTKENTLQQTRAVYESLKRLNP